MMTIVVDLPVSPLLYEGEGVMIPGRTTGPLGIPEEGGEGREEGE